MPIAGVVISCLPESAGRVAAEVSHRAGVDIRAVSARGELVAVLETVSSEALEQLMQNLGRIDGVLHVGLSFLNTEDEAMRMAEGTSVPRPFGDRRHERDAS